MRHDIGAPRAGRQPDEFRKDLFIIFDGKVGRRRGRYNVERLIEKQGNAKILYLLSTLTNRPKTDSADIYDRCKARYEGLAVG